MPREQSLEPLELASAQFGQSADLALVTKTKRALAEHYALTHGLELSDPDVAVVAFMKAWVRCRQFALIQETERQLFRDVVNSADGADYNEALFYSVQSGRHHTVMQEIRRLHEQARGLDGDLRELARRKEAPGESAERPQRGPSLAYGGKTNSPF